MTRLHKDRQAGFTLIEVLVALAMLVIVIGAIYGAFSAGNQSTVLIEENSDLHQTARVILGRINSELLSIYPSPDSEGGNLIGDNSDTAGNEPAFDKIKFTTVAHEPSSKIDVRGDVCTVTYSEECTADGKPVGLYIIEDFTPGLHNSQEEIDSLPVVKVSDLVIGMDCTYLDPETDEWVDEWVEKQTLPKAVRVELILQSKRQGAKPITVASTTNLPTWVDTPPSQETEGASSEGAQPGGGPESSPQPPGGAPGTSSGGSTNGR